MFVLVGPPRVSGAIQVVLVGLKVFPVFQRKGLGPYSTGKTCRSLRRVGLLSLRQFILWREHKTPSLKSHIERGNADKSTTI